MMQVATSFPWTPPSPPSLAAFLGIVAAVVVALLAAVAHAAPPSERARHTGLAAVFLVSWMVLGALLGPYSLTWLPVSLFAFFFGTNGSAGALALSPVGRPQTLQVF